jgi:hypothetical protein
MKWFIVLVLLCGCNYQFPECPAEPEAYQGEVQECAKLARKYRAKTEVRLEDGTRCDLVNDTYAIECEYPDKWAEAIGQSLYYGIQLNKKPAILFLIKDVPREAKFVRRCKVVAKQHEIEVFEEYIGPIGAKS